MDDDPQDDAAAEAEAKKLLDDYIQQQFDTPVCNEWWPDTKACGACEKCELLKGLDPEEKRLNLH